MEERDKRIDQLNAENASLKSEIESLRRKEVDLAESNANDRSYNTDMNDRGDSKTEKRYKIVMH